MVWLSRSSLPSAGEAALPGGALPHTYMFAYLTTHPPMHASERACVRSRVRALKNPSSGRRSIHLRIHASIHISFSRPSIHLSIHPSIHQSNAWAMGMCAVTNKHACDKNADTQTCGQTRKLTHTHTNRHAYMRIAYISSEKRCRNDLCKELRSESGCNVTWLDSSSCMVT